MTIRAMYTLLAAGLMLPGCAGKPMVIECSAFRTEYTSPVPLSSTMAEIQREAYPQNGANTLIDPGTAAEQLEQDRARYQQLLARSLEREFGFMEQQQPSAILALSGGGQWGAFGASYLQTLDGDAETRLPQFTMVTGVSTGALQALFVGASQAKGADRAGLLAKLTQEYAPDDEREIVNRGSQLGAVFTGSVARLGPLRKKIEAALCSEENQNPRTPDDCELIKYLASEGAPTVVLGFVEARTGQMQAVNVTAIAIDAIRPKTKAQQISIKTAQQCITGGALASVAMPFFYQQVQVKSRSREPGSQQEQPVTYYDGGVRQSMFLMETSAVVKERVRSPEVSLYLLRNGPTIALASDGADKAKGAIINAMRGYSLIVNQSEVTAIETIRLRDPNSEVRLATADGYDYWLKERPDARVKAGRGKPATDPPEGCLKTNGSMMFEPQFMRCLQDFGKAKAKGEFGDPEAHGWTVLTKPKAGTEPEH